MKLTVAQLAKRLGAELVGQPDQFNRQITAVGPVEAAGGSDITFISSDKHRTKLKQSQAGAVIISECIEDLAAPQLIVKNVDAALIEVLNIFAPELRPAVKGIDPTAKIGQSVTIAEGASIGPGVVIDDGAKVGTNSIIAGGCKIGQNSKVGENCRLDCNVVVYHNCTIGNNVIIQANTTVGSTGFAYAVIDGCNRLIPHNGTVVIEDFVEIGANSCVDRAKFGQTRIGAGTKIDNFVQIAHNVVIGKCCLIAGQVGIAGSCKIGDGVILAGHAGLSDNIEIGDGTMVGATSVVFHSVGPGQKLFGTPALIAREAIRGMTLTKRLPKLVEQLKQLITRVENLETAKNDKK